VREHVERGIECIQRQTDAADVDQRYDELYVTAEFDRGEVVGYIDHLLVTPSTYHGIDYRTGDVSEDEVIDDAACYVEQMHAYAVALAKQDPTRFVRIDRRGDPDDAARGGPRRGWVRRLMHTTASSEAYCNRRSQSRGPPPWMIGAGPVTPYSTMVRSVSSVSSVVNPSASVVIQPRKPTYIARNTYPSSVVSSKSVAAKTTTTRVV